MASNFWESPHAAELVPRSAVLNAHAEEREAGLGDGDIEGYKALVVEYIFEVARHSGGALRQRVVATASTYARRHLHRRGLACLLPHHLALAALFLASKVEESHVSAEYLLSSAARASSAAGCDRGWEEAEEAKGKEAGGGARSGVVSVVASSSQQQQQQRGPAAAAPHATKPSLRTHEPPVLSPPLPVPRVRQLLAAEAELLSTLGARGLLLFSPYPEALEAAAAVERERERMTAAAMACATAAKGKETTTTSPERHDSGSKGQERRKRWPGRERKHRPRPLPRLGARAWAAVSSSLSRTDLCLWCPPHVVGLAAAAVAAAAADADAEEGGEADEGGDGDEFEGRRRRDDDEMEEGDDDLGDDGVYPSVSFSEAASSWFSTVDVDLGQIADAAAEICYAAGVERARGGATARGGRSGGGAKRADAAVRVFALLRSKAKDQGNVKL